MNLLFANKTLFQKTLAVLLAFAVATPTVFSLMPPPPAQATVSSCISGYASAALASILNQKVAAVLSVPVGTNGQIVSQAGEVGNSISNFFKDCIEHGLALMMGKMLLSQMTNQIVNYINGGFSGSSAFASNPGKLFSNIGNQVVANALNGIDQGSLGFSACSPFSVQLRAGLAANFGVSTDQGNGGDISSGEPNICSLVKQVGGAIADQAYSTFQDWGTFLGMSMNEDSNPYGAFLAGVNNIQAQISLQVGQQALELNWGNGFLSQQDCTHTEYPSHSEPVVYHYTKPGGNGSPVSATVSSGSQAGSSAPVPGGMSLGQDTLGNEIYSDPQSDTCNISTPGKTIADTLQNQLNVPADQLGLADDLDKIFNALFNELMSSGLGTLGLGGNGIGGIGGLGLGSGGLTGVGNSGIWKGISNRSSQAVQQGYADAANQESIVTSQLSSAANNTGAPGGGGSTGQNSGATNVAQNASVSADPGTRSGYDPNRATDGNTDMGNTSSSGGFSGTITTEGTLAAPASLTVDLGQQTENLIGVVIYPHNPACTTCWGKTTSFKVVIKDQNNTIVWDSTTAGYPTMNTLAKKPFTLTFDHAVSGRYVTLQGVGAGSIQIAEVQVTKDNGPTITINGQSFIMATPGKTLGSYDTGASALDATGASVSTTVSYSDQAGSTASASTAIQSGHTYLITYTATDSYGASSNASRTVESIPTGPTAGQ